MTFHCFSLLPSLSPPSLPPSVPPSLEGSVSWNGDTLCSGSRDHRILQWDIRAPLQPTRRLEGHSQEVCGLKWSPDRQMLASGGNDNKVGVEGNFVLFGVGLHYIVLFLHVLVVYMSSLLPSLPPSLPLLPPPLLPPPFLPPSLPPSFLPPSLSPLPLLPPPSLPPYLSPLPLLLLPSLPPSQLFVWNASSSVPVLRFSDHCAAVKAIAWSPHQHCVLASGGGTADRSIRFWNTLTGQPLQSVDTGSQVCVRVCGCVCVRVRTRACVCVWVCV